MLLDKGFKSDCSRLGITIRSPPASRFESLLRQRHFQVSACKLTESQIARCALTLAPGTLDRPESPDQSAHQRRHSALTRRRHLEVRVGGTREDCGTFAQINCAFHCVNCSFKMANFRRWSSSWKSTACATACSRSTCIRWPISRYALMAC